MDTTIQGVNLSKAYQMADERLYALNDLSLDVYPGEMAALSGRTGSGKSTLLHFLGCFQKPDSGQIFIEDRDVTQLDDEELAQIRRQKIGFVFQAFNLLPNESALANVELPLREQGMSDRDIRRKAGEALEVVGLENRLDRMPSQLSARQRQCVSIARALVNNPAIILADEPTRGLDSTSREEVMGLFQKLNYEGQTMVIATADSGVANYCRRVVRLVEGKPAEDRLVSRRRIIPSSRIPGPPTESQVRQEEAVCPRCNYGNTEAVEVCNRCGFPVHLTQDEQQSIQGRLSGSESRWLGVESASDEGDVPGGALIEELKEVSFLSGLGNKSLVKVIPALEPQHFSKGSTIVKQGDPADAFYIVRSGEVQVVLERQDRLGAPIATSGAKEGFGEMALLTDRPYRSFTIVAITDVELWRLPKPDFNGLLSENHSLAFYFNRLLSQRLTALEEKVCL